MPKFRCQYDHDQEFRRTRTLVELPYRCLKVTGANWDIASFPEEFVEWMENNLVEDCYFSTCETRYSHRSPYAIESVHYNFYFRNPDDALFFKLRWQG